MDNDDKLALDVISLPLWEPATRPKRSMHKMADRNRLTRLERDSRAEQTVGRMLGITQDEFAKARLARMQREGAKDDKDLGEKLSDLIHHIDLASDLHATRHGTPSIALATASRLACELRDRLSGVDAITRGEHKIATLGKIVSHARMPGVRNIKQ